MESSGFSDSEIDFIINQSFQRSIAINNSRDHGLDCGTFNIYQIYNSLDNTLIHETTELSFTHEGLSNGTEYCYYISVQYEEGESDPSDAVCATPNELSEINYSLSFDGVDDKVDIHNSQGGPLVGTDDFSVAFWFKTNNLVNSTTYKMLASSDDYDEQWAFAIEYGGLENQAIGTLSFIVNTGGQNSTLNYEIRSEERIDDGNWHFAVGTREKSTGLVKLYIDGILYNSSSSGSGEFEGPTDIVLGMNIVNSRQYDGHLEELSVWTKKLDEFDIQNLMQSTLTGAEQDLVGYWNFNDGEGYVLTDISGYGNNGDILGATWSEDVPCLVLMGLMIGQKRPLPKPMVVTL